jgi:gluconate 2-dehydrogenase gamma chain
MTDVSRRTLFQVAGAIGASAALPAGLEARERHPHGHPHGHGHGHEHHGDPAGKASRAGKRTRAEPYLFLNPAEAAFLEAAVDRLIPPDEKWPGAVDAGVPTYIDRQLAGAYGQGARLYKSGPWEAGLPTQGYQLALTPAQLYRRAIPAIEDEARRRAGDGGGEPGNTKQARARPGRRASSAFAGLSDAEKDALLSDLEGGRVELASIPSAIFFETLLANTIEGFLSDPVYGGNRDMAGWRMIGFPGAYASYLGVYTNHGQPFTREPMSIADGGHEHQPGPVHGGPTHTRGDENRG